jgi:hypothetical protein
MKKKWQIRHSDLGIFQGEFMGLVFWWPMTGMPEQGICGFPCLTSARNFILYLRNNNHNYGTFTIEKYNWNLQHHLNQFYVPKILTN